MARKCSCGEPIFREDRDCCDSCYNTGITPTDNLDCIIIYGFDDYHSVFASDEKLIGCSMHDDLVSLRFIGFKQVCCLDMKDNYHERFKLYNDGGYSKPKLHDVNPTCRRRTISERIAEMYCTEAPSVDRCPYCGRPIRLVEEDDA